MLVIPGSTVLVAGGAPIITIVCRALFVKGFNPDCAAVSYHGSKNVAAAFVSEF
jgi:hypothetical protein